MIILRQSTSSAVLIGPFVDDADGNTAETALTISNTDIRLSKNGANIVAKNSGGGTHDELGYYTITLNATDTNTVGRLQLMVHEAGALPVYHEFMVVEEAVYDAMYASGAVGPLEANDTGTGLTAMPWNASWDAEVQSECADALNAYDPPTRTELTSDINSLNDPTAAAIADAIWDELQSGHVTAGSFGEIATEIASILADTNELQTDNVPGLIAALNDLSAAQVNAEVDTALTDYDPPTRAELTSDISGLDTKIDTIDINVDDLKLGVILGAAATGTLSTTQATSNLTGYADDQLIGRVLIVTSGNADGEATQITDYASASGLLTFDALTTAMANGDTFKVV